MIKRLLNGQSNTIASAAVIVASFSVLSRFVGFARDRILAGAFGAGDELDIYFAAFRLPDLIFQLIIVGALSASFIPLFTKYYEQKNLKRAWELTNITLNFLAIAFGIIVILASVFAFPIAQLVAPGFDALKQARVADLSRIMFLAQVFLAISMVYGSALQGAKRFVLYSLAPIFYNIGIIAGAIFFVPALGITGVAWGVVLGGALHLLLQWLGVNSLGYKYSLLLIWRDSDVRYILKHMLPRVLGLAVNQINFVAMTAIASFLAVGSVTVLQFAYTLDYFPVGVVAVSFAIAVFPTLCDFKNKNDRQGFIQAFSLAVRQMLFFIIPATFTFLLLRAQIVRVVLGAGEYDWQATILTADTLGLFALSFFAQGLVFILIRGYFAYSDTVTPFIIGLTSAIANIGIALALTSHYGVMGLAGAYSIAAVIQIVLLWLFLHKKVGSLDEFKIFKSTLILLIAGLGGALVTQGLKYLVVKVIELDTFFAVLAQGLIAGGLGIAIYCLIAYLLKSEEMMQFIHGMKRRLFRRAKTEESIVTQM